MLATQEQDGRRFDAPITREPRRGADAGMLCEREKAVIALGARLRYYRPRRTGARLTGDRLHGRRCLDVEERLTLHRRARFAWRKHSQKLFGMTVFFSENLGIAEFRKRRDAIAQVYYQKAGKSIKNGKQGEAEADMKQAIALDPDSVLYLIALARLRHQLGTLKEAETLLDGAMQHFKDAPQRSEIDSARQRLRQTETILAKLRQTGV